MDQIRTVHGPYLMGFTLVYVFYFHWLFCYVYLLRCSSVSHYNTTLHPVHFPSKTLHVDSWTDVSEKRQIQALLLILQLGTQTFCLFVVGFITFSVHLLSQRCAHARFRFVYKKHLVGFEKHHGLAEMTFFGHRDHGWPKKINIPSTSWCGSQLLIL